MKEGTEEFKDKTDDIDQQIQDEIDDMLDKIAGSDYTPVSYASSDNTDIGLVQFAVRTDDIKVKEEVVEEKEETQETIWDKVKKLF